MRLPLERRCQAIADFWKWPLVVSILQGTSFCISSSPAQCIAVCHPGCAPAVDSSGEKLVINVLGVARAYPASPKIVGPWLMTVQVLPGAHGRPR